MADSQKGQGGARVSSSKMTPVQKIIREVWWRRIAQMFALFGAGVLLDKYLRLNPVERLAGCGGVLKASAFVICAAGVAYLIVKPISRRYGWRFDLGAILRYPPTWIPILAAFVLLLIQDLWSFFNHSSGVETWLLALVFAAVMGALWRCAKVPRKRLRNLPSTPPQPDRGIDEVGVWLDHDMPVESEDDDFFGAHSRLAWTVVERLKEAPTNSVVLYGSKGAGKSTIGNFVKQRVADSDFLFVDLSLWPYESVDAAVRGIIETLVHTLAKRVDVSGIVGVSSQYRQIVSGNDSRLGALLDVLTPSPDVQRTLEGLNERAQAAGVFLFLWIDDLERFEPRLQSVGGGNGREVDSRIAALQGLLYQLDSCTRVTLLVATASLGSALDSGKLGRFAERIPPLKPEVVMDVIQGVRMGVLERKDGEIDPVLMFKSEADRGVRAALDRPSDRMDQWSKLGSGLFDEVRLALAVGWLLDNPRALKVAARRYRDKWTVLRGEIDPDDVLLLAILETVAEDVLVVIEEHFWVLAQGAASVLSAVPENSDAGGLNFKSERAIKSRAALEVALERIGDPKKQEAAETVLKSLFPQEWDSNSLSPPEKPQGVGTRFYRKYLGRYLEGVPIVEDQQDQPILKEVMLAEGGEHSKLVARLMAPICSDGDPSLMFIKALKAASLLALAALLGSRVESLEASGWGGRGAPVGGTAYLEILKCAAADPERRDEAKAQLKSMLDKNVGTNLPLVAFIRKGVLKPDRGELSLVGSPEDQRALLKWLKGRIEEEFLGEPMKLVSALQSGDDLTIGELLMMDWRLFTKWDELRETFLQAAAVAPHAMAHQLTPYLITNNRAWHTDPPGEARRRGSKYLLNQELDEPLFSLDQLRQLSRAITVEPEPGTERWYRLEALRRGLVKIDDPSSYEEDPEEGDFSS